MTASSLRVADYLAHIQEAIARILSYTSGMDEAAFRASQIAQDAVIRNLEVVGEASRNIARVDPGFAASNPSLPLVAAYEMRNVLAHGYFKIDLRIVWNTLQRELPVLREQVASVLLTLDGGDEH